MRSISAILAGLPRLGALVEREAAAVAAVSGWSIGQHLDHLLKAHAGILDLCDDPPRETPCSHGITLIGRLALFTGHIPRGRGRSPARFLPDPVPATTLRAGIAEATRRFTALDRNPPSPGDPVLRFAHPVFGGLTRAQWLRFAEIHQRHHLSIIDDIVQAIDHAR
jgi:hypothetical protein